MTKLILMILCLSALLPTRLHAHANHHHSETAADSVTWSEHLTNFRQRGYVADLEAAKAIERSIAAQDLSVKQLYLAAQTAQSDHRFTQALEILDQLLIRSPGFQPARLMRANTLVTLGRAVEARTECAHLQSMPASVVLACRLLTQSNSKTYATLVKLIEVEAPYLSAPLHAWVLAVLGDYALNQEKLEDAVQYYFRAYDIEPLTSYQLTRVEALLRNTRCEDAMNITDQFRHHIAMQVKHSIAARRCGTPNLEMELEIAALFDKDIAHHDFTHGREMAEFHLFVTQNLALARHILTESLKFQRTAEDERLWRLANSG